MARTDDLLPSHPRGPYAFGTERVDEYTVPEEAVTQHEEAIAGPVKDYADAAAAAVASDLTDLDNEVHTTFRDGVITESEASSISRHLNQLATDNASYDEAYWQLHDNPAITANDLATLNGAKSSYDSAYNALVASITSAIADSSITSTERLAVDNAFETYGEAVRSLEAAIQFATAYTPVTDDRLSTNVALLNRGLPFTVKQFFNQGIDVDGAADFGSTIHAAGAATLDSTLRVTGKGTFLSDVDVGGNIKLTGIGKTLWGAVTDTTKAGSVATWEYVRNIAAAKTTFSDLWDQMIVTGCRVDTEQDVLTGENTDRVWLNLGYAYVDGRRCVVEGQFLTFSGAPNTWVIYLNGTEARDGQEELYAVVDTNIAQNLSATRKENIVALVGFDGTKVTTVTQGKALNGAQAGALAFRDPFTAKLFAYINGQYSARVVSYLANDVAFWPELDGMDLGSSDADKKRWQTVFSRWLDLGEWIKFSDGSTQASAAYTKAVADGRFASITHNHDSRYSLLSHNHDGRYQPAPPSGYSWEPAVNWNTFRTPYGYIQLGPTNSAGFAHIYTDQQEFYFNKPLKVNGTLVSLVDHNHDSVYLRLSGGALTGLLSFPVVASAGNKIADFGRSYSLWCDNTGSGGVSRLWFDAPNLGEIVLGGRASGDVLNRVRIRAGLLLQEGDVSATGDITAGNEVRTSTVLIGKYNGVTQYARFSHVSLTANEEYGVLQDSTGGHLYLNSTLAGDIYFRHNNVTKMTLTDEGRLGIGTIAPDDTFHVVGGSRFQGAMLKLRTGSTYDPVPSVMIKSSAPTSSDVAPYGTLCLVI